MTPVFKFLLFAMVASRFDILYSYVALDLTVFGFIANSNCNEPMGMNPWHFATSAVIVVLEATH